MPRHSTSSTSVSSYAFGGNNTRSEGCGCVLALSVSTILMLISAILLIMIIVRSSYAHWVMLKSGKRRVKETFSSFSARPRDSTWDYSQTGPSESSGTPAPSSLATSFLSDDQRIVSSFAETDAPFDDLRESTHIRVIDASSPRLPLREKGGKQRYSDPMKDAWAGLGLGQKQKHGGKKEGGMPLQERKEHDRLLQGGQFRSISAYRLPREVFSVLMDHYAEKVQRSLLSWMKDICKGENENKSEETDVRLRSVPDTVTEKAIEVASLDLDGGKGTERRALLLILDAISQAWILHPYMDVESALRPRPSLDANRVYRVSAVLRVVSENRNMKSQETETKRLQDRYLFHYAEQERRKENKTTKQDTVEVTVDIDVDNLRAFSVTR